MRIASYRLANGELSYGYIQAEYIQDCGKRMRRRYTGVSALLRAAMTELQPGDVIATGTPSGVGAFRTRPIWMKAGELVEVEISGVGLLANRVVDEQSAGL